MFYAKYNVKASIGHSHKTLLTADFVEKITNSIPYKRESRGLSYIFTLNVIAVSETTIFLLSSSIPDIEADLTSGCVETERVNFYTKCG